MHEAYCIHTLSDTQRPHLSLHMHIRTSSRFLKGIDEVLQLNSAIALFEYCSYSFHPLTLLVEHRETSFVGKDTKAYLPYQELLTRAFRSGRQRTCVRHPMRCGERWRGNVLNDGYDTLHCI